jgi:adenylate kinase family enzyme
MVTGLIVLEGPDGVGKTTLGKYLVEKYDAFYMHCSYHSSINMYSMMRAVISEASRRAETQLVIIDRFWPSEDIYGVIHRKKSSLGHMARVLDRLVQRLGGIYIVLQPGYSVDMHHRFQELATQRKEMYPDNKKYVKTLDAYKAISFGSNPELKYTYWEQFRACGLKLPLTYLDSIGENTTEYLAEIITSTVRKPVVNHEHQFCNGNVTDPKICLLQNINWTVTFDNSNLPGVNGEAIELTKIFHELSVSELDFCWFSYNFNEQDDSIHKQKFIERLKEQGVKFIALNRGRNFDPYYLKQKFDITAIPMSTPVTRAQVEHVLRLTYEDIESDRENELEIARLQHEAKQRESDL